MSLKMGNLPAYLPVLFGYLPAVIYNIAAAERILLKIVDK